MIRLTARRTGQADIQPGGDTVLFGLTLPSDTILHAVRGTMAFGGSSELARGVAVYQAVEGYVFPLADPDAAEGFESIWDKMVPKDTDVLSMDLDTQAQDTTPFFEPGEADWSALLDLGFRPERIYHRHRLFTYGSPYAAHRFQDNQSPFANKWTVGDYWNLSVTPRIRVTRPSVVIFAMASPSLDDTIATVESALTEPEMGQVKYIGHVLERAMLSLFGVVEAGAETPWEEATKLLQKHLDPDVFEATATRWGTETYNVFWEMVFQMSVPGKLGTTSVNLH